MHQTRAAEEAYWSQIKEMLPTEVAKFELGQTVTWTRESKGKVSTKTGKVVEVVAPGYTPDRNKFPSLYDKHPEMHKDIGNPRKEYSYVVRWIGAPYEKRNEVGWPLTKYLSAAVGKPLVDVLEEEKNETRPIWEVAAEIAAKIPEKEWDKVPSIQAFEKLRQAEESDPVFHSPNDPSKLMKVDSEIPSTLDDDDLEDVEAQVARDFDKAAEKIEKEANYGSQTPSWNLPGSRMFVGVHHDGHDGGSKPDGDIKTDSDPDRELGHHLRGALRILSEAFFGKKKTPHTNKDTYIKELEESIKSQDVWKTEIEEAKARAQNYADQLLLKALQVENAEKENERLKERVQKEIQTQTATLGDSSVDKLRKELEFSVSMLKQAEAEIAQLKVDYDKATDEVETWKDQYAEILSQKTKLQDNFNLLKVSEVAPETSELKDEIERYKNLCSELDKKVENLESHAEKREEQIVAWLEKIEILEADAKDAKSKNSVLPEPAVKFLQSEVIRLQGELATAKESAEHYRNQSTTKSKSGRKVSSDESTIRNAIRFTMDKVYSGVSGAGYKSSDGLVDSMYQGWEETSK